MLGISAYWIKYAAKVVIEVNLKRLDHLYKKLKKFGITPFAPKNTTIKAIITPKNRPIIKNLNSIIPSCPLFSMSRRTFYKYIKVSIFDKQPKDL